MSSPTSRRSNRNSVNGTPRRSNRNPAAPPSSDPVLPDAEAEASTPNDQLRAEAERASQNGSQQNTPRASARSSQLESQSQVPPTSSPLFFQQSPAASQSQSQSQTLNVPRANGFNISSPLRQQSAVGSSEGARTPRANGEIGGEQVCTTRTKRTFFTDASCRVLANTLRFKLRSSWPGDKWKSCRPQ